MHIIRTWDELARHLDGPVDPDTRHLLEQRRSELIDYGDLEELGTFALIQPGDTPATIQNLLGYRLILDGMPMWEWVKRHGSIFEAPVIISDGFGHVLIIPATNDIDPDLLALCREHA